MTSPIGPNMCLTERIAELGLTLPEPPPLLFEYEPVRVHQGIAYLAGQVAKTSQTTVLHRGPVGSAVSIAEAQASAALCVLNGLAWLRRELGTLDTVDLPLQMRGYVVADTPDIVPSQVVDGATEMLLRLFGSKGRCPRTVIGVSRLPFDSPVLIELAYSLRPQS